MTPRRRGRQLEEGQVSIRGDRVRIVLALREMSLGDLAAATGDQKGTLQAITRRQRGTCATDRRRRIAEALRIDERWLGGEVDRLPMVFYDERDEAGGAADPDQRVLSLGDLAAAELRLAARAALRRDLRSSAAT